MGIDEYFALGQISVQYSNSSDCSTVSKTGEESVEGFIRSSAVTRDFTFPPSQLGYNQSLVSIYVLVS